MFSLKTAWRFLRSGKGQTILILAGIAIGISVQVFIGLLIQGLQTTLIDTTIGSNSQVTVGTEENYGEIEDWENIVHRINQNVDGIRFISPTLTLPSFISIDDERESTLFRGFDLDRGSEIYKFDQNLVEGSLPEEKGEVIVGIGMRDNLGLILGDSLNLFNFQGQSGDVTVVGFVDFKITMLNDSWIISNLPTAQEVFDRNDTVTAIEIQVERVFDADLIGEEIDLLFGGNYVVTNWKEENQELLSGLRGQDISSIMIQVFVVIAVVLGIASVLAISVIQRSKQIGILKAMGVNDGMARNIFLYQGLILGLLGGILGVSLGLTITYLFTLFATNPDGSPVVAISMNYQFVILSFVIAVVASTSAALIPARRSSRLEPIEVIRNG